MNLRTWTRYLLAVSFTVSGLIETLGATGVVFELSPDGLWGSGTHTLAVGGPLQLVGAAVLLSGRQTRLTLRLLGCYLVLASLFGNLPHVINSNLDVSALAGLLANLAVLSGIFFCLCGRRTPGTVRELPFITAHNPGPASLARLVVCLAVMGCAFYWLNDQRMPTPRSGPPAVPVSNQTLALPVKLLG